MRHDSRCAYLNPCSGFRPARATTPRGVADPPAFHLAFRPDSYRTKSMGFCVSRLLGRVSYADPDALVVAEDVRQNGSERALPLMGEAGYSQVGTRRALNFRPPRTLLGA